MARITVEDCLAKIGNENRFALIHLAVERVKQHRRGAPFLTPSCKNKEIVCTLREIARGSVRFNNLKELAKEADSISAATAAVEAEAAAESENGND